MSGYVCGRERGKRVLWVAGYSWPCGDGGGEGGGGETMQRVLLTLPKIDSVFGSRCVAPCCGVYITDKDGPVFFSLVFGSVMRLVSLGISTPLK